MSAVYRILIVEDEPNVRLVFRSALETRDYEVATATDGEAALDVLRRAPFDLVLLDLQMPGMGGMEVLARIRDRGDHVPVVIVSAHDRAPNVVQAMRLGAIDFLSKPLTPDALRGTVADVIARQVVAEGDDEPDASRLTPASLVASAKRAIGHRLFYRAEGLLREAIRQDPDAAEPHYLLGLLHEVEGKPKAASESYRDALEVDPDYEPARLHLLKFPRKG